MSDFSKQLTELLEWGEERFSSPYVEITWGTEHLMFSVLISLREKTGKFYVDNFESHKQHSENIDLSTDEGWKTLRHNLQVIFKTDEVLDRLDNLQKEME